MTTQQISCENKASRVELSSNFCHLSDIIWPPLRTNDYENSTVVFSPHTPCGRVRLARFTLEDHAYDASRLPKTSKNDCFAVYSAGDERDLRERDGKRERSLTKNLEQAQSLEQFQTHVRSLVFKSLCPKKWSGKTLKVIFFRVTGAVLIWDLGSRLGQYVSSNAN